MRIYDISVTISEDMAIYGSDPAVEIEPVSRISRGDTANVSLLRFGSHTGTHVDAPRHFIESAMTIDRVPLDVLVGECYVCEIPCRGEALSTESANVSDIGSQCFAPTVITVADLETCGMPEGCRRILFKTSNSGLWKDDHFHTDFVYLDPDAAAWLVEKGIRLVGIDYLSVDRLKSGMHPTHLCLLESGAVVVEGLDLSGVTQGTYFLVCLPLKIRDGDAAPARAILIEGVGENG